MWEDPGWNPGLSEAEALAGPGRFFCGFDCDGNEWVYVDGTFQRFRTHLQGRISVTNYSLQLDFLLDFLILKVYNIFVDWCC